jgi:signal transduction histidine kinase/ActR/RegA family two-component response regulator
MSPDAGTVDAGPSRTRALIVWTLSAVVVLSLAAVLLALDSLRDQQLLAGERDSTAQVRAVDEMVAGNIGVIDANLILLGEQLLANRDQPGFDAARMRDRLRSRLPSMPSVRAVWVLDANGRNEFDSDEDATGTPLADRDYFRAHKDGVVPGLFIGQGARSKTTGKWFIGMSRALRAPDGQLLGVIVAAMEPGNLMRLWDTIDVGADGAISLLMRDGTLLIRSPHNEAFLGRTFVQDPLLRQIQARGAEFSARAPSGIDGIERIFSLRAVRNHPQLIAVVGKSTDHVLAPWRQVAAFALGSWAAASLLLAVLCFMLLRELRTRWLAQAHASSLARLTLEDPNPVMRVRADGAVLFANEPAQQFRARAGSGDATRLLEGFIQRATKATTTVREELELMGAVYSVTAVPMPAEQHFNIYVNEVTQLKRVENSLRSQLLRTELLNQITRAIAERRDLVGVSQVACDEVRGRLPADLAAVVLRAQDGLSLSVQYACRAPPVAGEDAGLDAGSFLPQDARDIALCLTGRLVHEPDLAGLQSPFASALRAMGLRAMVLAPLQVESRVFGFLVTARREAASFSSGECEFLRQLSEHAALAAHQAELHGALQAAYDDLSRSQQAILQHERLRTVGQMASGIAHDINNAISPVTLYTEALLDNEPGMSAKARKYLETIQLAIDDVTRTVSRMREFYRPSDDGVVAERVSANLLVQQVLELTRARWKDMPQREGKVVTVTTGLQQDLPDIMVIAGEIRDVLTNLVVNAIDAMPDGGVLDVRTGRLAVGAREQVCIAVTDTGCGMDELTLQRCMEPFFTTKGERGTGLGLAMAYGTMQRQGGTLEISSEPGKGTTVVLSFDIAAWLAPQPESPIEASGTLRRLHVLVVDDDPEVLRSLSNLLELDGHTVHAAAGGQAGIEAWSRACAQGEVFDAVITDLGMPGVDGRQVAHTVKSSNPATPVLMLTGWGQRMEEDADRPQDVDHVLAKPPRLAQVRQALALLTRH